MQQNGENTFVSCRFIIFDGVKYMKGDIIPNDIVESIKKHKMYEQYEYECAITGRKKILPRYPTVFRNTISELGYIDFDGLSCCSAVFSDITSPLKIKILEDF